MSEGQLYFDDVSTGDAIPEASAAPSELQIFFFSAVTNNGHRIHYDLPYAKTEGLPNILVQGPLQAALLAKTLTDWIGPGGRLTRIQFERNESGAVLMPGTATVSLPRRPRA